MGVLSQLRLKPAATVPREVDLHPLVVYSQPSSAKAAKLRALAQEVFANVQAYPAIAVIPVDRGKTASLVLNLAYALAEANHKIAVIEADLRSSQMAVQLKLTGTTIGLADVLEGQAPLAATERQITPLLTVLPGTATSDDAVGLLNSAGLYELVKDIAGRHTTTFVLCPPACEHLDYNFIARACDGIVVVAQKDRSRMPDIVSLRDEIERLGVPLVYALLDR